MHHVQVATVDDGNWDLGVVGSGSEDALALVPMDAQHDMTPGGRVAELVGNVYIFQNFFRCPPPRLSISL